MEEKVPATPRSQTAMPDDLGGMEENVLATPSGQTAMPKGMITMPDDTKGMISVIVTVRNEAHNIEDLLESLIDQEPNFEVVIIDAGSSDGTLDLIREFQKRSDVFRLIQHGGTRGVCRNLGVDKANGDVLAFIDGDCIAGENWLSSIRRSIKDAGVVAGKTVYVGYAPFVKLDRVELFYKGYDLTYPSCNLAYTKKAFNEAGGFDPWFVTAEDIDLNYRAVDKGYKIRYCDTMKVVHKTRGNYLSFFKQAFWNGFGRKQLTLTHGPLWTNYKPVAMLKAHFTFHYFIRLWIALLGYFTGKVFAGKKLKTGRAIGGKEAGD